MKPSEPQITVDIVRTAEDFNAAMQLREINFVKNEHLDRNTEFDGNDYSATHVLAKIDGTPAATMRIRYFCDFVRLERFCKAPDANAPELVDKVLEFTSRFIAEKGYSQTHCYCKEELVHHWLSKKHHVIEDAKGLEVENMKLFPISLDIERLPEYINIKSSPDKLIAAEGRWNLNQSQKARTIIDKTRAVILKNRLRFQNASGR